MESTPAIEAAEQILFIVGVILSTGAVGGFIARQIRVPDIVMYIFVGVVLGPQLTGLIHIGASSALNQIILIFGASYIIFDGGASLRLQVLKEVWITIAVIATIGVVISAVLTGLTASWLLGLPLMTAVLLGAVIAPTDPATLVPVFKQVEIKERVAQTVVSESAFNDAMGAIITITLLGIVVGSGQFSGTDALLSLLQQVGFGFVIGIVIGYVAGFLIAHERFAFLQEYSSLVTLMVVIGAYLGATGLNASGFMAAFVAGIIVGNLEVFGLKLHPGEEKRLESYVETTALIMRMFIFVLLGAQVDFGLIQQYWLAGIGVVLVFMFIARPIVVFLCTFADRRAKWTFKERFFMCWVRETGVIPASLAGLLLGMHVPGAKVIASVTFIAILMTILLQATTTKWLARKLDLLVDSAAPEQERI